VPMDGIGSLSLYRSPPGGLSMSCADSGKKTITEKIRAPALGHPTTSSTSSLSLQVVMVQDHRSKRRKSPRRRCRSRRRNRQAEKKAERSRGGGSSKEALCGAGRRSCRCLHVSKGPSPCTGGLLFFSVSKRY
jgi:hypothetical protein